MNARTMRRPARTHLGAAAACLIGAWLAAGRPAAATPGAPVPPAAPLGEEDGGRVGGEGQTIPDHTVVTPGRREGKAFEAAGSVSRVDTSTARTMGARTLPETLEETAGVSVQMTNRGAGAPILRGLIGPSNMLMLDGLRYHQSTWRTGPNQYLATLEASAIDSIEVLLGSQSVSYGSSAMGGVMQVVPAALPEVDGARGNASLRFTSADKATEGWGRVAFRQGALSAVLGGGYRSFGALRLGGGELAPISGYSQGGFFGRARYELAPTTAITASYVGNRLRDAGRADNVNQGDLRWYDNDDDMVWLDARHRATNGVIDDVRLAFALHRSDEIARRTRCKIDSVAADVSTCVASAEALAADADSAPGGNVTRQNSNQDTVRTLGGVARLALRPLRGANRERLRLDVGAEVWNDVVTASTASERRTDKGWTWSDGSRGNFSADSSFTEMGGFATAEVVAWQRPGLRLVSDLGARFALFSANADDVPKLGTLGYDASGLVGSASLRLIAARAMGYLSWHQGFRAPNLQETTVLGDTGSTFEVPNAALTPERSDAFELGGRLQLPRVSLHAALWWTQLNDAIDSREVPTSEYASFGIDAATVGSKPVRQRINRGEATLRGAQLTATGRLAMDLQPWVQLALTQGEVLQDDGSSAPYRRIPPLGGAAGLRLQRARWSVELFARFAAAQDQLASGDESDLRICEDPANPGKTYKAGGKSCPGTPGWVDVGARGGLQLGPKVRLDLVARNLLDARYRVHGSGVDAAGIGGSLAVSGQF